MTGNEFSQQEVERTLERLNLYSMIEEYDLVVNDLSKIIVALIKRSPHACTCSTAFPSDGASASEAGMG